MFLVCLASAWAGVRSHSPGHTDGSDTGARGVGTRHLQQGERQLAAQRRRRRVRRLLLRAALHGSGAERLQRWAAVPGAAADSAPGSLLVTAHGFSQGAEAGECQRFLLYLGVPRKEVLKIP